MAKETPQLRMAKRQLEEIDKYKGYVLIGGALDDSDPYEPFVGLVLLKPSSLRSRPGPSSVTVWVQQDPEGNGPGFLDFQKP